MVPFERRQLTILLQRLDESPLTVVLVEGPRQVGKTTMIEQARDKLTRPFQLVSVDEPEQGTSPRTTESAADGTTISSVGSSERNVQWLVRCWEEARLDAARSQQGSVLALDEIQKIPNWSEAVKGLWDADRRARCPLHVILSGSAPLLMQRGLTESLAGRFETIKLTHWSFAEMARAFDFDVPHYVYFGGYPRVQRYIDDEARWQDYILKSLVEPNIERDILAMQRVDKPALFKRLFEVAAMSSGQILAYNKMLGQLQEAGNTTTLARYLDLLERAGLIAGLQNYSAGIDRRKATSPKLVALNTALMSALSGYTFAQAQADRTFWGRLVENAVGAHLYNSATAPSRLWYWRRNSAEVDYVLERGPQLVGFEVKSGQRHADSTGLERFQRQYQPVKKAVKKVLVGGGGVPLEEFLSIPGDDWFEA